MSIAAKVFVSKDGDRFLVPGYWEDTDDAEYSSANLILNAIMFSAVCQCKAAPGFLRIDTDAQRCAPIPNQPYELRGRQFAHGGISVMLIGGPTFEECWKQDHPDKPIPASPLTDEENRALLERSSK